MEKIMKNKMSFLIVLTAFLSTLNAQSMQLPADVAETARTVDSNQKTLVLGSQNIAGQDTIALYLYNTDNNLDTSFGTAGTVTTVLGNSIEPQSIEVQQDGKILVKAIVDGKEKQIRFNENGSLDWTFGEGGIAQSNAEKLP